MSGIQIGTPGGSTVQMLISTNYGYFSINAPVSVVNDSGSIKTITDWLNKTEGHPQSQSPDGKIQLSGIQNVGNNLTDVQKALPAANITQNTLDSATYGTIPGTSFAATDANLAATTNIKQDASGKYIVNGIPYNSMDSAMTASVSGAANSANMANPGLDSSNNTSTTAPSATASNGTASVTNPNGITPSDVLNAANTAQATAAAPASTTSNAAATTTTPASTISGPSGGSSGVGTQSASGGTYSSGTSTSSTTPSLTDFISALTNTYKPTTSTSSSGVGTQTATLASNNTSISAALQFQQQLFPQISNIITSSASTASQQITDSAQQGIQALYDKFNAANAQLQPYTAAGASAATSWADLVGVNGNDAQSAAITQLQNSPAYQFTYDQGMKALQTQASALGLTEGTTLGQSLVQYGQGFATSQINDQINRLSALATQGLNAATSSAQLQTQQGNDLNTAYSTLGQNLAQTTLESGGAQTQALSTIGSNITGLFGTTPANALPTATSSSSSNALSASLKGLLTY